jgi:peptidoglycan/xylan/chitin deacetylase (PgdA/CDA1 family)
VWTSLLEIRRFFSGLGPQRARRTGIQVFCYHGVVEPRQDLRLERNLTLVSDFQAQIDILSRSKVLSLGELKDELQAPAKRRKSAVVITFDDGYANNLLAAEMLAAARLPWAVFVSTGALGRGNSLWTVELSLLLLHGRAEPVEALGQAWPLTSRQAREDAFQAIRYPLKAMPADRRREAMVNIRQQFPLDETQRLLHEFPSLQMLTWEEVGQLAGAGGTIGSHGVHHEIHHANQPEAVRRRELTESKTELEQRLGRPCRHFAFPNGDFNQDSAAEVQAAAYDLAFTLEPRTILPGENPYLLPRLAPNLPRIY